MLLFLLYMLLSKKISHRIGVFSTCLILAGGVGNLIDRVIRPGNFVVDYIDFRLINFAVFNLADICIVCGTILLMLYLLFIDGKETKKGSESHD